VAKGFNLLKKSESGAFFCSGNGHSGGNFDGLVEMGGGNFTAQF